MGDRCQIRLSCLRKDLAILKEYFEVLGDDGESPVVDLEQPQANWGYSQELEEWGQQRLLTFMGSSGPGLEYGSAVFAAIDGEYVSCEGHTQTNDPVVRVYQDGPSEHDQADAERYWKIRAQVEKAFTEAQER